MLTAEIMSFLVESSDAYTTSSTVCGRSPLTPSDDRDTEKHESDTELATTSRFSDAVSIESVSENIKNAELQVSAINQLRKKQKENTVTDDDLNIDEQIMFNAIETDLRQFFSLVFTAKLYDLTIKIIGVPSIHMMIVLILMQDPQSKPTLIEIKDFVLKILPIQEFGIVSDGTATEWFDLFQEILSMKTIQFSINPVSSRIYFELVDGITSEKQIKTSHFCFSKSYLKKFKNIARWFSVLKETRFDIEIRRIKREYQRKFLFDLQTNSDAFLILHSTKKKQMNVRTRNENHLRQKQQTGIKQEQPTTEQKVVEHETVANQLQNRRLIAKSVSDNSQSVSQSVPYSIPVTSDDNNIHNQSLYHQKQQSLAIQKQAEESLSNNQKKYEIQVARETVDVNESDSNQLKLLQPKSYENTIGNKSAEILELKIYIMSLLWKKPNFDSINLNTNSSNQIATEICVSTVEEHIQQHFQVKNCYVKCGLILETLLGELHSFGYLVFQKNRFPQYSKICLPPQTTVLGYKRQIASQQQQLKHELTQLVKRQELEQQRLRQGVQQRIKQQVQQLVQQMQLNGLVVSNTTNVTQEQTKNISELRSAFEYQHT